MKQKVLFLCTGNSARSQIAESILRKQAGDRFEVFSAGLEPKGILPLTVQVLEEKGYDLAGQYSKSLDEYRGKVQFDYLITVCGNAEQRCPLFPGMGTRLHWPFDDPAAVEGSDEDMLDAFRTTRDAIETQILDWLK
jgi:arsenate reductase